MNKIAAFIVYAIREFFTGFKEGHQEAYDSTLRKNQWYDMIPYTFNKYQDVCVWGLRRIRAPKMVLVVVVLTNIFFYYFALLSVVSLFFYFLYKGIITIF